MKKLWLLLLVSFSAAADWPAVQLDNPCEGWGRVYVEDIDMNLLYTQRVPQGMPTFWTDHYGIPYFIRWECE